MRRGAGTTGVTVTTGRVIATALVTDIINPLVGVALGAAGELKTASLSIGTAHILYGDLVSTVIDFIIVALVVYYGVTMIGLDKLDKKKD